MLSVLGRTGERIDLRPRQGARALGRAARADPRHPGPDGRLDRQHPRRAGGRRGHRPEAPAPVRHPRGPLREPERGDRPEAAGDARPAPRPGVLLASARGARGEGPDRDRPGRRSACASRTRSGSGRCGPSWSSRTSSSSFRPRRSPCRRPRCRSSMRRGGRPGASARGTRSRSSRCWPGRPPDLALVGLGAYSAAAGSRYVADPGDWPASARLVGHDLKGLLGVLLARGLRLDPDRLDDTAVAAYLLNSGRAGYPLDQLCLEATGAEPPGPLAGLLEGRAPARPTRPCSPRGPGRGPRACGGCAECQRPLLERDGLERVYRELEMPLVPRARRDGARRHPRRARAARGAGEGAGAPARHAAARDPRARRRAGQPELAQAARHRAVREAQAPAAPADQDRLLDRRRRAGGAGARPPAAAEDPRLPPARQAQGHLRRRAAAAGQPAHRAHPHVVQPARRGDGAAVVQSTRTFRTSPSAPSSAAASARRSSPRRAGASWPPTTRRSSCGSSPTSRARRCCSTPSAATRTSTPAPPPRSCTWRPPT